MPVDRDMRCPARGRFRGGWAPVRALVCALLVAGGGGPGWAQEVADPIEPVNRAIFRFNDVADRNVIEPIAWGYRRVTPEPVRRSVRNFLGNLGAPVVFANDLLQGERDRAGITLARFMINSTLGVFGLFDVAGALGRADAARPGELYCPDAEAQRRGQTVGCPGHSEDFGQTLAVWGVGDGPYLVLPLLGPSNLRDTGGRVGDYLVDPWSECCLGTTEGYVRRGAGALSQREELLEVVADLRCASPPEAAAEGEAPICRAPRRLKDQYTIARSVYGQRRALEILNGRQSETPYETLDDPGALDDPAGP